MIEGSEETGALAAALGTAWNANVSVRDDDEDAKQTQRQERLRKAFEAARESYVAKVDEDAWFFSSAVHDEPREVWEAPDLDTKTVQRLGRLKG